MQDPATAAERLNELKALGVHLAVDDFGTGYSSLNYLRSFPIDVLKIDKSFVDRLEDSRESLALTAAIVQLAAVLGMRSLAEGIEDESQLERLITMGCQYGQGFHLSRPLDRENLEAMLDGLAIQPAPTVRT